MIFKEGKKYETAAAEARKQATEDRLREQERQRTEAIREKERAQEAAALRKPQKEQAKARPKTETLKMNPNAKEQQPAQPAGGPAVSATA